MYFPECESCASRRQSLRTLIERLDERLSTMRSDARIRASSLAPFLREDESLIEELLTDLAQLGLFREEKYVSCPRCETLISESDFSAALDIDGTANCTSCDSELIDPESVRVFRFAAGRSGSTAVTDSHRGAATETTLTEPKKQLVLLIHGIRTQAEWQGWISNCLRRKGQTVVIPLKYGYLDVFRFWCPFIFRNRPINELIDKIEDAIGREKPDELIIVAHSFGSYAIASILRRKPRICPKRMILCGSVVARTYRWDQLPNRPEVINDCGTRDVWPVLAEAVTWGYGSTGTHGFGTPGVHDRFHDVTHSEYFNSAFVEKYWKPWVHNEDRIDSDFEVGRATTPLVLSLLPFTKAAIFATGVSIVGLYLCPTTRPIFSWSLQFGRWLLVRWLQSFTGS